MNKERRKQLAKALELLLEVSPKLDEAKGIIEQAGTDEREYVDAMSDNLKAGDKGQQAELAADNLDEVKRSLDDLDIDDLIAKVEEAQT